MLSPPNPPDEKARLAILKVLNILDTQPSPELDACTNEASEFFDVPIALISLVDESRQWFKSCIGLSATETERNISFCGHAILNDEIFFIQDAASDVRFYDNPLVTGPPHIRFYAGAPLTVLSHRIGTLCIIDSKPRSFSRAEFNRLRLIANKIEEIIASQSHL